MKILKEKHLSFGDDNHVMLDIETMGNKEEVAEPALLAIGATRFNPLSGQILDRFSSKVNLNSSLEIGMQVGASTVYWWMQQSEDAKKSVILTDIQLQDSTFDIENVLVEFSNFARDCFIWGYPSSFDVSVLASAYLLCGMEVPWRYNEDICLGSIVTIALADPKFDLPKRRGVKHDPLFDSEYQVSVAYEALKCLPLGVNTADNAQ